MTSRLAKGLQQRRKRAGGTKAHADARQVAQCDCAWGAQGCRRRPRRSLEEETAEVDRSFGEELQGNGSQKRKHCWQLSGRRQAAQARTAATPLIWATGGGLGRAFSRWAGQASPARRGVPIPSACRGVWVGNRPSTKCCRSVPTGGPRPRPPRRPRRRRRTAAGRPGRR